jgi:MYXO-CTERM domain-containing protein
MRTLGVLATAALALAPATAHAFCGFYVAGSSQQMFNDATQVVLMRQGTRTVLAMQNNYKGPPEAFAMVIPVPAVLHEGDVKTLPKDVFAHVEQMGAPRLVEYWEQDPCAPPPEYDMTTAGAGMPMAAPAPAAEDERRGVKVEARFNVGEYQIVILSAKDSTGLEGWLRDQKYNIPAGAEPLLRPYVEGGSKFFVAKVDPTKVKFEDGRAALSPLRFHYDADEFSLPIRLGLANSQGTQDLIVNILAPNQRYEVANYDNVTVPTNLDVTPAVKDRFGAFYAALFDATIEKHKGAIVTEYAWQATTCDPCPGPTLDETDFLTLGADVLAGPTGHAQRYDGQDFVLTRLHARYGKDVKNDLVFRQAPPIVGGREFVQSGGQLEQGARQDAINNFQARYAIRHPWTGPITCQAPKRGIWGGPPGGQQIANGPTTATNLAFAPRGGVQLAASVPKGIPELGVTGGAGNAEGPEPRKINMEPPSYTPSKPTKSGCGCTSSGTDAGSLAGFALIGLALVRRRR